MLGIHARKHNSEYLRGDMVLPTIADIVDDPQQMAQRAAYTVFVDRAPTPGEVADGLNPGAPLVYAVSEADLLTDFDNRMRILANKLKLAPAVYPADQRRFVRYAEGLRRASFMSAEDRSAAVNLMALHWLARLEQSPDNEVIAVVEADDSSSYVFALVEDAVRAMNPEAAARIMPVTIEALRRHKSDLKDRIAKNGLTYPDDWAVSGTQGDYAMRAVAKIFGPDIVQKTAFNLLCAPKDILKKGIGGAACLAACQYDYDHGQDTVSVAGSHSIPIYGFRMLLNRILHTDGGRYDEEVPLLQRIRHLYRATHTKLDVRLLTPEQESFFAEQQRRIALVGKIAAKPAIAVS